LVITCCGGTGCGETCERCHGPRPLRCGKKQDTPSSLV
jgi:hypothetical protein